MCASKISIPIIWDNYIDCSIWVNYIKHSLHEQEEHIAIVLLFNLIVILLYLLAYFSILRSCEEYNLITQGYSNIYQELATL